MVVAVEAGIAVEMSWELVVVEMGEGIVFRFLALGDLRVTSCSISDAWSSSMRSSRVRFLLDDIRGDCDRVEGDTRESRVDAFSGTF